MPGPAIPSLASYTRLPGPKIPSLAPFWCPIPACQAPRCPLLLPSGILYLLAKSQCALFGPSLASYIRLPGPKMSSLAPFWHPIHARQAKDAPCGFLLASCTRLPDPKMPSLTLFGRPISACQAPRCFHQCLKALHAIPRWPQDVPKTTPKHSIIVTNEPYTVPKDATTTLSDPKAAIKN